MDKGRVFHTNGYIEYADGAVVGAGFFKQEQPGYNPFQQEITHTTSVLPRDAIKSAESRNHPLLSIPRVKLDITFPQPSGSSSATTTVHLVGARKTHEIGDVLALDNSVLVDHVFKLVAEPASQPTSWNVTDLRNAKINLKLRFFFIQGISTLPSTSWPSLHNFQLWLGPRADKVLSLDPPRLVSHEVRIDLNPIARGQAECIELVFETSIDEGTYAKCLLASA